MTDKHQLDPAEAIARVFSVVVEEAKANPAFARRLLTEMGASVMFSGTDAVVAADPVIAAASMDYAKFRETFQTFSEADLKKMLTNFGLGTAEDVRNVKTRPKKIGFVELLWAGACQRLGKSTS